jgi:hypothetical protein
MIRTIGAKVWAIPGGHVPLRSSGEEPRQTSRDELCVLNAGHVDVSLQLTIYYEDRDPVGPYPLKVPAQRVRHVRFNDLIDPHAMPLDTPYAALIIPSSCSSRGMTPAKAPTPSPPRSPSPVEQHDRRSLVQKLHHLQPRPRYVHGQQR